MTPGPPEAPPANRWRSGLLSLMLAAAWLLLQQSLALPHLLFAALLGWGLPRWLRGFLRPASEGGGQRGSWRRAAVAARLAAVVLWDIVLSNLAVARIVLGPVSRAQPAWVPVPLTLRDPTAVALLASIITTTPGTVSCVVDDERWQILVHALDCADPAALVAQIRQRYEAPLKEVFE